MNQDTDVLKVFHNIKKMIYLQGTRNFSEFFQPQYVATTIWSKLARIAIACFIGGFEFGSEHF